MRTVAVVLIILVSIAVPCVTAAVPEETRQAGPVLTAPELDVTGVNITNHSIPSRYAVPPTLVDIKVELSETALPAPKGEMASGPRTIGFAADPVTLAILAVAIVVAAAGVWYLVRRRPGGPGDEDNGN